MRNSHSKTLRLLFVAILAVSIASCATPKIPTTSSYKKSEATFTGIASWYGRKFNGRRTASGARFNMHKMTAAHRNLPFGTVLEITNLKNEKKVLVTVTDRGPFVKNRVLDVSYEAAKRLDFVRTGIAHIRARVVND